MEEAEQLQQGWMGWDGWQEVNLGRFTPPDPGHTPTQCSPAAGTGVPKALPPAFLFQICHQEKLFGHPA